MKYVFLTLKSGIKADMFITADAAEDLKLCVEEKTFKRFIFKTSENEIISFCTFDVFKIKVDDR